MKGKLALGLFFAIIGLLIVGVEIVLEQHGECTPYCSTVPTDYTLLYVGVPFFLIGMLMIFLFGFRRVTN